MGWGSQPTYEELKRLLSFRLGLVILSSQPTYEELKLRGQDVAIWERI